MNEQMEQHLIERDSFPLVAPTERSGTALCGFFLQSRCSTN